MHHISRLGRNQNSPEMATSSPRSDLGPLADAAATGEQIISSREGFREWRNPFAGAKGDHIGKRAANPHCRTMSPFAGAKVTMSAIDTRILTVRTGRLPHSRDELLAIADGTA